MFGLDEEQKLKNIPPKYEYLRPLLDNIGPGRICLFIRKHYAIYNVAVTSEAPIITALYLYNNKQHDYERIKEYTYKYFGKHASSRILQFIIEQDMGLEIAAQFWDNRNTSTSKNFYNTLEAADEKYIDMVLSSDKFYRATKIDIESSQFANDLGNCPKILEIGKKYKRFVKLGIDVFTRYGDPRFVAQEVSDIFLF